jgi:hypothetical protein
MEKCPHMLKISEIYGKSSADLHVGRARIGCPDHPRAVNRIAQDFPTVTPEKLLDLMRLGTGDRSSMSDRARTGIRVADMISAFYETLAFPRLENGASIRAAVAEGVRRGLFGYVGRAGVVDTDQLREDTGYMVDSQWVTIGKVIPELEIDEGSGLIVLPQAIRLETPPEPQPEPEVASGTSPTPIWETPGGLPPDSPLTPSSVWDDTVVRLKMRMNRGQVYAATQVLANLAQQAGEVEITVEAAKYDGFDPQWLQNAVLEPLDEADVKVERE